jgi:hypothetical protein
MMRRPLGADFPPTQNLLSLLAASELPLAIHIYSRVISPVYSPRRARHNNTRHVPRVYGARGMVRQALRNGFAQPSPIPIPHHKHDIRNTAAADNDDDALAQRERASQDHHDDIIAHAL